MRKQRKHVSNHWAWILAATFVNFEGVAGFMVFLLIITVFLLWLVYTFAQIVVPAIFVTFLICLIVFVPFHYWSRTTIRDRCVRRISKTLQEIRELEQLQTPRDQILPLEQRIREAAQVLSDCSFEQYQKLRKPSRRQKSAELQHQLRTLQQDLEKWQLSYTVIPDQSRWCRLFRLHLERDWVRWIVENPGAGRIVVLFTIVTLTTAFASLL